MPTKGEIITFTDESAIFYEHCDWEMLRKIAKRKLYNFRKWFHHQYLTIKMNVTLFMPICSGPNQLPVLDMVHLNDNHRICTTKNQIPGNNNGFRSKTGGSN